MSKENAQASSKKGKNIRGDDDDDEDRTLADQLENIRNKKKRKNDVATDCKAASKKGKEKVVQDDTVIKTTTLAGRRNTDFFVDMLESLNKNQRRAVREIGFAALLNFNIRSFPRALAYYLIYNFIPKSSSIELNSGESLFLDDEDVHITLGFPIGSLPINRIKFQKNINIKTQIARFCKGGEKKMVPKYVVEQMERDEEGGEWFKWTFMVLVEYALINTPADGNVSPKILDYIADVEKIKQYNWCSYVISRLHETQKRWKKNAAKIFTGPVIFVVACYVDRIVFEKKMVPRCYPTVKGWTAELLKERQRAEMNDSDFGLGHKYDRYKKQPHEENDEDDESEDVEALKMNDHDEEGTTSGSQEKTFIDEWKEAARDVKASMLKMVDVLEAAPDKLRNLNSFKIICDTTRNAMELREEGVQHVIESQKTMTQAMSSDEIDDPEWIDIMIELTKASERTYILKNRNEFPTFTLIPEYEYTPDENQNFNREKDMEKEKDDEVENEQEKQNESEKEKVLEKEVQNEEYEHDRVDTIISTIMEDINGEIGDDEVLKQREENLKKDKGKKMVSQEPPVEKEKVVRTTKKIVEALCSPYNVRAVNLKGKLNKEEKEIMYWLMTHEESEYSEVVYENNKMRMFKIDFHSLAPRTYVSINIIDAWVVYLNYHEKFKSKASPSRLFINTTPTVYNITARKSNWTEAETRERFCSKLNEFVSKIENFKWENYDMIFFPIWAYEHFYIICFNLKMQMMDVIDNALISEQFIEKKYGDAPSTLKNFFRIYLGNEVNPPMGRIVKLSKIRHMNMPWQNDTNKVDCGVYVMRHLETYMGDAVRNWNSGLTKKGTESFTKLRARYTEALLIGDTNKKAFDTFTMIQKKFENDSKKGEIDVEKMIREFKPPKES